MPYTRGGSGADVFTETLAQELRRRGHAAVTRAFPHAYQYAPWLLSRVRPPANVEIILANTWNAFAFRRTGIPLVAVEHLLVLDPALAPYKTRAQAVFHALLVARFERATARGADRIVAVSNYTARRYAELLPPMVPMVIINGIDTDFFTPAPEGTAPITRRPTRLLFIGNLSRRKGADLLPAIMAGLGAGFELSYTSGLRENTNLPDAPNYRRLGRLTHEQVRSEYRRADLILLPTRMEGLPLVAIEAMACGTPVVATRVSSLPEAVDDSVGTLCPLDDVAAFVAAIRTIAADPTRLAQLRHNARQRAESRFSLTRMVNDYLHLFESLVAARATRTGVSLSDVRHARP